MDADVKPVMTSGMKPVANSGVKSAVIGVGGVMLAGLLAGWIYASSLGYQLDPGALFDPHNTYSGVLVFLALFLAARALRPFSVQTWRFIWIAAAILYPICMVTAFHAITGLAQQSVLGSYMQRYQDNFRVENGRDATPQETAFAQEHLQQELDQMPSDPNMGHQAQSSVNGNWFWGPIWVSLIAGIILKTRGYRLKHQINLGRFIEKTDEDQ